MFFVCLTMQDHEGAHCTSLKTTICMRCSICRSTCRFCQENVKYGYEEARLFGVGTVIATRSERPLGTAGQRLPGGPRPGDA